MNLNMKKLNTKQIASIAFDDSLEEHANVQLAKVVGIDERRNLPKEWFVRRPIVFLSKLFFAIGIIAACWTYVCNCMRNDSFSFLIVFAVIALGCMYAHLVELQHECLHNHAFRTPALNRIFGVICGIFVFSSYSHYRYDHLRHHAYLGTEHNLEHFDYRFQNLDSWFRFMQAFFDLSRYNKVAKFVWHGIRWNHLPGIEKASYDRDIKVEYIFYFSIFIFSVVSTALLSTSIFLIVWWIPALLISEGVHFLIEMPEHFGLNTQTNANVLSNTRTIKTSWLISWFVNGNDKHTAHHFHQGVPMRNVKRLHRQIENRIEIIDSSYWSFYRKVMKGELCQNIEQTCMKR